MNTPGIFQEGRGRLFLRLTLWGVGQALVAVLTVMLIRHAFDGLFTTPPLTGQISLGLLAAGLCGLAALALVLRVMERTDAEALGQAYAASLRLVLFDHLLHLPLPVWRRKRRGHLMLRFLGDLNAVQTWVSRGVARLLVSSVAIGGALAALLCISVPLGLLVGAVLATVSLAIAVMGPPLTHRIRQARRRRAQLAGNLGEKLAMAPMIQSYGRVGYEHNRLCRHNQRLAAASVSRARLSALVRLLPEVGGGLTTALIILVGARQLALSATTPGAIVAALSMSGVLLPYFSDLARLFDYWQNQRVAWERIQAFLALPSLKNAEQRRHKLRIQSAELRFEDVTVAGMLAGIDITAPPNSLIAVVGPNGGGKSTLLAVAAGLLIPDQGRVLIDDQDLAVCTLSSIRRRVGILTPDFVPLRGTIEDNLRYRTPAASAADIERICDLCELSETIARLPQGLKTPLGEGGHRLSAGVRRRVLLAQMLLADPPLLLLDEVDAELDAAGRRVYDRLLRQRAGTTLVVTHDPQRLRQADQIWHLAAGQLIEAGAPNALLLGQGPTARLFGCASPASGALFKSVASRGNPATDS